MKRILVALLLGVLFLLVSQRQRSRLQAQSTRGSEMMQFRITVGLADTQPKPWQGRITVAGGALDSLGGWRFSAADHAAQDGSFSFETKIGNFENQLRTSFPYGQTDWGDPNIRRLIPQGLILRLRAADPARVTFASPAGTFEFDTASVPFHSALAVLDGNARIERMPAEQKLSESGYADDEPALAIAPDGTPWTAWVSYQQSGDYISVSDGRHTARVTDKGTYHSPAIAVNPRGWVHVVWSQRDDSEFHLYQTTRAGGRWTAARRLTEPGSSNIHPRIAAGAEGRMALVWQSLRGGQSQIRLRVLEGGGWSPESRVDEGSGNSWAPAAAWDGGKLWIAWDSYATGAYQIYVRQRGGPVRRLSAGENFSVRPALAVRKDGVPVIAWEESGPLWGKDYAFLTDRRGSSLYADRRVRMAFLQNNQWKQLPADIAGAIPAGQRRFVQQPQLLWDSAGRLYALVRVRTSAATARIDHWAAGGYWEAFLTRLEGSRWVQAIPLPFSTGRNSMRAAMAAIGDQLYLVWPTDNRSWGGPIRYGDLDIYATRIPTGGAASTLDGQPVTAPSAARENPHPAEPQDTARIRAYRIQLNGKTYRIVRGDLHRHTELSQDGAGDGSLDDLYRYALDAAAMDFAHVGDHQMGSDEEYNWWITQKSNDLYFMPQRFVPLYGYERSVPYPNGHRNIIWAERGKPVLPIGPSEQKGATNTGSVLYPYLKETGGIATSHTSATPQGTDWRDNDPALEPFVEIYQGFESNYEHAGAPRAWKEGDKPVHTGLRPAGYVWNAWAKGYKLGVQASSDHVSTHTSYACILVEEFSRHGLLAAMRQRHTYAATDSIVLDFRANGKALMGDIIDSAGPPQLQVKVAGTAPIRQVDVIRNNTYIHKAEPNTRETSFEYVDTSASSGESYYYVRVQQTDGQLAWSSPIWVKRP